MLKWQNQKCKFYDIIIILFWEECRLDERYVDFKYVSSHAPFQFFMNVSLTPANRAEIMYICIHVWKLQIWKITIINSTQCIQRFAGGGGGRYKNMKNGTPIGWYARIPEIFEFRQMTTCVKISSPYSKLV